MSGTSENGIVAARMNVGASNKYFQALHNAQVKYHSITEKIIKFFHY